MADKKVVVEVEIKEANKAGPGLRKTEDQLNRVADAADGAKESVAALNAESDKFHPTYYAKMFDKLQSNTIVGMDRALLAAAKQVRDKGGLQTLDEFKSFANSFVSGGIQTPPPIQGFTPTGPAAARGWPSMGNVFVGPTGPAAARGWPSMGNVFVGPTGPAAAQQTQATNRFNAAITSGFQKGTNILVSGWQKAQAAGAAIGGATKQFYNMTSLGQMTSFEHLAAGFQKVQTAALVASAASMGFVASMAPMTWRTFTGSVQLLGGEIAGLLIPAFTSVSGWIQRAAAWVGNLDAGTKRTISTVATWGGALLIGGTILGKFVAIVGNATFGLVQLGFGLGKLAYTAMMFSPWVTALTAVVGVVGLLTNGFGLLGDSISRAGQRADESRGRIERLRSGGQVTRSDYESIPLPMRSAIENARPDNRRRSVDLMIGSLETDVRRQMAFNPSSLQSQIETILQRPRGFWEPEGILGQRGRQNEIVAVLRRNGMGEDEARRRAEEAVPFRWTGMSQDDIRGAARIASGIAGITEATAQIETLRRVRESGIPGLFSGTMSASPMQPRTFTSGTDAYYTIMQEALGRGQVELEVLRKIMENTAEQIRLLAAPPARAPSPP